MVRRLIVKILIPPHRNESRIPRIFHPRHHNTSYAVGLQKPLFTSYFLPSSYWNNRPRKTKTVVSSKDVQILLCPKLSLRGLQRPVAAMLNAVALGLGCNKVKARAYKCSSHLGRQRSLNGVSHARTYPGGTYLSTAAASPQDLKIWYRLLYFNTRGAAEPIRYLMALHNVPYQDIRYPLQASAKGFGVDRTYLQHQKEGRFRSNLNKVPVLQILKQQQLQPGGSEPSEQILAEIGQTHAILRFLDQQHGTFTALNPLQRAHSDSFVEALRDAKADWYKSKSVKESKDFVSKKLPGWCRKLEDSLPPMDGTSGDNNSPWLIGGEHPSLADVCLLALLAAPTSILTGASQSFFDGASQGEIQQAYRNCPRLHSSVTGLSKVPAILQWEARRPDTFN